MSGKVVQLRGAKTSRPRSENRNLPPKRISNSAVRSREYFIPDDVEALIKAAKRTGRHGHRNATLILIAYRHGLRVSELIALRWDQVDLKAGLRVQVGERWT